VKAAKELGLLEQQPAPAPEVNNYDATTILSGLPANLVANVPREIDRDTLYAALEQLADEEDETDAAA
jgi:hypothetical protein